MAAAKADRRTRRTVRAFGLISDVFFGIGTCALVVAAACAFQGDARNAGYIAAFALGIFPMMEALSALPAALADAHIHAESVSRLDKVLHDGDQDAGDPSAEHGERRPAPEWQDGDIAVSHVLYRYPGALRDALSDVTLRVPHGSSVAVLGKSGAGKSTLAAVLRGAIEADGGEVRVGGPVAFVPHDPYIFDQTLRENLLIAAPDATDGELADALARVGLGPKLESLARGLDTHVGETGIGVSGGEAHRVSLARALLADAPIVLLDEPFAAVDPLTEKALIETMLAAFRDRTLVVITHHLALVESFDRVLFIEDGRITLDGPPRDLMRSEPSFARLVNFDRGIAG